MKFQLFLLPFLCNFLLVDCGKGGGGAGRGGVPPPRTSGGNTFGARPPAGNPSPGSSNTFTGNRPPVSVGSSGSAGKKFGGIGTGLAIGAAGGLAAGVIGSSIAHDLSNGARGGYYGDRYYYAPQYYPGPGPHSVKCTLVLPDNFTRTSNDSGRKVTELIYECDLNMNEICCDSGCCAGPNVRNSVIITKSERPRSIWTIIAPLIVLAVLIGISCFAVCACIKRRNRNRSIADPNVHYYVNSAGPNAQVQTQPYAWKQDGTYAEPNSQPPPPPYTNYGFQQQQPAAPYQNQQYAYAAAPSYPPAPVYHAQGTQ